MKQIATLITVFVLSVNSFAEVSKAEKKALLELYKLTNGAQWINKWDCSKPVSTWYGVTVANDKVVSITLSENNLTGTLPAQIGDLQHLQSLVLFKNNLQGVLPSSLGLLKNLRVLNVSFNKQEEI